MRNFSRTGFSLSHLILVAKQKSGRLKPAPLKSIRREDETFLEKGGAR
jgi:hypothetical protein